MSTKRAPGTDHDDDVRHGVPRLIIFDVNETLSDMAPMQQRFSDVGVPAELATSWFAGLLRDGFALTAVGSSAPFAQIAAESLRIVLHGRALDRDLDDAVTHVMDGFAALAVHADVVDGIRALGDLGASLVTLSNGSATVAEALFDRAGVTEQFERLLTVEDAAGWKPAPEAYQYALDECDVDPADAMLVAVHAWDIDGAARAGLRTAWVNRSDAPYPSYFTAPELAVTTLPDLAEHLR